MIAIGDKLPDVTLATPGAEGPQPVETGALFAGKKAVMFAVPGAFTPTCHLNHMPGFVAQADAIRAKGVDEILCLAVNDPFVLGAWGESVGAAGKVTLLADGSAAFTKAIGLDLDLSSFGMGVRSKRFAMIVEDGVVRALMVEDTPKTADASGAEAVLAKL
ncbi:MAG: peroxiredoxin [Pseudomonadota bacterium]